MRPEVASLIRRRHRERSEAIQKPGRPRHWIASSLRSPQCWPADDDSACSNNALTERTMTDITSDKLAAPKIVDRNTFQAELDALRVREKAHTKEGDDIAAARRRLSMVEVDGATPLIGERGAVTLLD